MKTVTKEILEKYIELVDESILIEDLKEFGEFCIDNSIDSGLCLFLEDNQFETECYYDLGLEIIRNKYLEIYNELEPLVKDFWFKVKVYQSEFDKENFEYDFELKKRSLLARQQVVKDILEKHFN